MFNNLREQRVDSSLALGNGMNSRRVETLTNLRGGADVTWENDPLNPLRFGPPREKRYGVRKLKGQTEGNVTVASVRKKKKKKKEEQEETWEEKRNAILMRSEQIRQEKLETHKGHRLWVKEALKNISMQVPKVGLDSRMKMITSSRMRKKYHRENILLNTTVRTLESFTATRLNHWMKEFGHNMKRMKHNLRTGAGIYNIPSKSELMTKAIFHLYKMQHRILRTRELHARKTFSWWINGTITDKIDLSLTDPDIVPDVIHKNDPPEHTLHANFYGNYYIYHPNGTAASKKHIGGKKRYFRRLRKTGPAKM
eukprot:CAMPEP_0114490122 /NCGR_PEP_ID=MMETSP0109-20121206/2265_1 /TAXON_ID=29199 /ORGANISM="Chlorarachnion reptans, Strain CCCM449" /LENGTH=310 /DNA_ID=CAMNT_0001666701 /DNA_START=182 /DNA_END=1114 /DNA_ORIENTATION=+